MKNDDNEAARNHAAQADAEAKRKNARKLSKKKRLKLQILRKKH